MSYKTLYVCIVGLAVSSLAIGMEIKRPSLMAAAKLGNIRVFHKDNKFVVERDGKEKNIQPCFVSPIIRNANSDLLSKFLVADGYLRLNELKGANGSIDYKLDACGRLNGGGLNGATAGCYIGKFTVEFLGHGAIQVVAWCTGPAYPATVLALEATFAPAIEAASNVGAIVGGITGGVLTGPI
ncbi:hypothetical protein E3J79_01840 [Candidatus Dependentiae bacterium]|nr:MAG: hypothetical protein E3J79_01840 [Candidatus Dependentiae bacterium]